MKKITIIMLGVVMGLSVARAALDETQSQIEQRYGAPANVEQNIHPATFVATYKRSGVTIYVAFINGRAHYKKYSGFQDADLESILKANQLGAANWVRVDKSGNSNKAQPSKFRLGGSGSYWMLPGVGAEAHKWTTKKNVNHIEFATDQWLKARASGF